jgi:hypothetical protein
MLRNTTKPTRIPQRRNTASDHLEFHGDVARFGHPKHARVTQEIPRNQK